MYICILNCTIFFSLPPHIHTQQNSNKEMEYNNSVQVNCISINESVKGLHNCSSFSWGISPSTASFDQCGPEFYTGSVCRQQLLAWQECSVGSAEDVYLEMTFMEKYQEESERDATQFLQFLCELIQITCSLSITSNQIAYTHTGSFGSDHCQKAAGLLICQNHFPLCDCKSGQTYLASREECETISTVECEVEWTSARQYGIPLPNCSELPTEVTSETHKKI